MNSVGGFYDNNKNDCHDDDDNNKNDCPDDDARRSLERVCPSIISIVKLHHQQQQQESGTKSTLPVCHLLHCWRTPRKQQVEESLFTIRQTYCYSISGVDCG